MHRVGTTEVKALEALYGPVPVKDSRRSSPSCCPAGGAGGWLSSPGAHGVPPRRAARPRPLARGVAEPWPLTYVNRLSDLLFVLSRWVARRVGETEYLWERGLASQRARGHDGRLHHPPRARGRSGRRGAELSAYLSFIGDTFDPTVSTMTSPAGRKDYDGTTGVLLLVVPRRKWWAPRVGATARAGNRRAQAHVALGRPSRAKDWPRLLNVCLRRRSGSAAGRCAWTRNQARGGGAPLPCPRLHRISRAKRQPPRHIWMERILLTN
jgi:hypothetical protein